MMDSNSIMNSADVEMQKVVVADLIHLSPDERDVLNHFDLAACDKKIKELLDLIEYPTREILISDVVGRLTLYQQKSQLEAKRYFQLQTDHQMALERENAAKLELSKAEERVERAEAKLVDLKADELTKASSQKQEQTPTSQTLTEVLEVRWSPVVSLSLLTLCRPLGARRDAHGSQVTQSYLTHHHLHKSIH
ncbi:hypothetical protein ILYODFUR_038997 [Ilyodon furcidens]|uniref:Cortactin-binding protein-2 N-terminal domain-containing protein n=1 Tax=Ilyodon furcidens TaxID=33524 RepID=A0ABV0U347_9TELE